jgi:hypothetical protein
MKRIFVSVLLAMCAVGCRSRRALDAAEFHVTAVTPDQPIDVVGVFGGEEYALSVDRANVPLYIAYYEPIDVGDVGRNFPAALKDGAFSIGIPGKGVVQYEVKSVREIEK